VAYGYFVESKNKRQLADLFGQYVPPELVDKMAENPLQYSMAARKHTLTVLFSDVVGFTSISEKLTPSELTEFINEYLSEMSFVIRKKGGTLDKYIGDAIMAFWGAPIDDEDHATNGVLAALGMHEKLQELKKAYKEKNWPDINVGIGLSTGPMTVWFPKKRCKPRKEFYFEILIWFGLRVKITPSPFTNRLQRLPRPVLNCNKKLIRGMK